MKTRHICFMLVACIVLVFSQAGAQDTGSIQGRVADASGHPLPGANVQVKSPALAEKRGAMANAQGRYRIGRLPEGTYEVIASFVGYQTDIKQEIRIAAGASVGLDFSLASEVILQKMMVVSASRQQEKILDAPASVAVVEAEEIRNSSALSVVEHIRAIPAVDHAQTGLAQGNTVVRGFNNVFSGALMTLVDNRISRVPSLRINTQNFIPLTSDDIERIEVVLGPGSALYGPNSANGVMHIITRSPFGSEGTTINAGGGERSLRNFSLRHAGSVNGKVGYKISTQYYAGRDWEYVDSEEVRLRGSNPRDYDMARKTGELRLDFRPTEETALILSAGYTDADNIEMTGLGAAQAKGWTYRFFQGRLMYKGLFAQAFYNRSDAGDTKLLRTAQSMVDKSALAVFQLQHSAGLGERQRFTYGADALLTRPDTEGTINGANENKDDINEYGFYLQSETNLSDQLDLVLAGRVDDHNHIENPVFSPRAALVFKPQPEQTLRFTYNRAFSTPTSTNLFLDLVSSPDAFGLGRNFQPVLGFSPNIDVRAQGGMDGFTFKRDAGGLPLFRSPFAPVAGLPKDQFIPLHDPQFTNVMWGIGRGAVLNAFLSTFTQLATGAIAQQMIAAGMPADQAQIQAAQQAQVLAAAFQGIVPTALPGLRNTLAMLNVETAGFDPVSDLATSVTDIAKNKPTITETFEVGYKGVIQNRLVLSADFYRTKTKDFGGPLRVETPNVFLEATSLSTSLSQSLALALQDPAAAQLAAALAVVDAPQYGGNGNGTPVDELTALFVAGTADNGAAYIPFGTITPEQATDPTAVVLAYRNFGQVKLYGMDVAFAYYPNDNWTVTGNYSYVSKDLFPNLDGIGDIALNAPRHKINLGVVYKLPRMGLRLGGNVRYRGEFPMNSGVYVGNVDACTLLDLNAAYELPINLPNASATLNVSAGNVLNKKHQYFIGAPEIGRLVSAGLTVRF